MADGCALFETAIGRCSIAWGPGGVAGVHLPSRDDAAAWARLRRRFPGAVEASPPPEVRAVVDGIVALLGGARVDLSGVALDMDGVSDFHRRVYETVRNIPPGATMTYGEVAALVGSPASARDVGEALAKNPFAIVVPCHRVVAAGGKVGGFSAPGGAATKLRMLSIEGAHATLFDAPH